MGRPHRRGRHAAPAAAAVLVALLWAPGGVGEAAGMQRAQRSGQRPRARAPGEAPFDSGPRRDPAQWTSGRADDATIRQETQRVVSQPRFAARWSLWEWLGKRLSRLLRFVEPAGTWGKVVFWIVAAWCVLALLAILGHLVWTVVTLVRGKRAGHGGPAGIAIHPELRGLSYTALWARMQQLAQDGRFRDAIGVMMAALLRWLEQASALRFHESKTNGDYVREFSAGQTGREDFRRFVNAFDLAVYGGQPCEEASFRIMKRLFERVRHAGEE